MGGLTDNILGMVSNNATTHNIKNALNEVGVKTSDNFSINNLPDIIRENLISNTVNDIKIKGGDDITITPVYENNAITYVINTNIDTFGFKRPKHIQTNDNFGNELNSQLMFDDLYNNILPNIKGVYDGDITVTDDKGNDTKRWLNMYFEYTGKKTGLIPNTKYLRLYLTSQYEPLYIELTSIVDKNDFIKLYNEFTQFKEDMTNKINNLITDINNLKRNE
jgi:hypothetical protein